MSVTKSYNRPKAAPTISTGLALTLKVAELPDSPSAIGGTGTTGQLDMRLQADADESGASDVQDLFKLTTSISIDASSGQMILSATLTPIKGDASGGTPVTVSCTHDEIADVWQAAAGRARQ